MLLQQLPWPDKLKMLILSVATVCASTGNHTLINQSWPMTTRADLDSERSPAPGLVVSTKTTSRLQLLYTLMLKYLLWFWVVTQWNIPGPRSRWNACTLFTSLEIICGVTSTGPEQLRRMPCSRLGVLSVPAVDFVRIWCTCSWWCWRSATAEVMISTFYRHFILHTAAAITHIFFSCVEKT